MEKTTFTFVLLFTVTCIGVVVWCQYCEHFTGPKDQIVPSPGQQGKRSLSTADDGQNRHQKLTLLRKRFGNRYRGRRIQKRQSGRNFRFCVHTSVHNWAGTNDDLRIALYQGNPSSPTMCGLIEGNENRNEIGEMHCFNGYGLPNGPVTSLVFSVLGEDDFQPWYFMVCVHGEREGPHRCAHACVFEKPYGINEDESPRRVNCRRYCTNERRFNIPRHEAEYPNERALIYCR